MSGDAPLMDGYVLERDPLTDEWIATSSSGTYKFRGRHRADLEAARWEIYGHLIEQFRAAAAELFPSDQRISLQVPAQPFRTFGCVGSVAR